MATLADTLFHDSNDMKTSAFKRNYFFILSFPERSNI